MLSEYLEKPWAIRREAARLVAAVLRGDREPIRDALTRGALSPNDARLITAWSQGDASEEELEARAGTEAARRGRGETVVRGGVAVIPLQGMITPAGSFLSWLFGGGAGGLQAFRVSLDDAIKDEEVASILINVDSPGGLTDLVPETAADIREARAQKPVVAIANTDAASAAYWLASQADELVVTPSGWVGSIGVFRVHDDWSGYNENLGVKPTYVSAGKYKTEGNPDEPLSDAARKAWQETVEEFYTLFVDDVAAGRNTTADKVRSGFGEGRMVTAQRALGLGMVDRVETFDETIMRLASGNGPARAVALADAERANEIAQAQLDAQEQTRDAAQVAAAAAGAPAPEDPAPEADGDMTVEQRRRFADALLG